MKIVEFSPESFNELKLFWEQLEKGSDMTVFQSYAWYQWLNESLLKEKTKNKFRKCIYFLCLDEIGKPLIIAPVQIIKRSIYFKGIGLKRAVYFIGRKGYTDYLNFIYENFDEQVVKDLLRYIKNKYNIDKCVFENVLEETKFALLIQNEYEITTLTKGCCVALFLPETFDLYKSSLKKHAKQNIRTAINRQNRNELELNHTIVYEIDEALQDELLCIRAQRLKSKNKRDIKKFSSKIYNCLRENVVCKFNATQSIFNIYVPQWCFLVKKDNKTVGFYWGIFDSDRKCYYVILAGVDNDYTWYSPSISHLYQWIQELYETQNKEIKIIDFTNGDERYKTDIGGTTRYLINLELSI